MHLAWRVDFLHALEKFENDDIVGLHNLIEFALRAPQRPRLIFASSIGAVMEHPISPIPEVPITDPQACGSSGYGQSKFVAERIIHEIAQRSPLLATIVRIGQISGNTMNGYWNRKEFIPLIIQSCLQLGLAPSLDQPLRWLPVDSVAGMLLNLVTEDQIASSQPLYFHIENHNAIGWESVVASMQKCSKKQIRVVSREDWLEAIKSRSLQGGAIQTMPVEVLLPFIETVGRKDVVLAVEESRKKMPALASVYLDDNLLDNYVRQLL
jgi:thioester reductase-like protein